MLTHDQQQRLLSVRGLLRPSQPPREMLRELVRLIAETMRAKVAVLGHREGSWLVLGESAAEPSLRIPSHAFEVFDRIGSTLGQQVEAWWASGQCWTLLGLSDRARFHVVLAIEGDWTGEAPVLREMARRLLIAARAADVPAPRAERLEAATRLTRALADSNGLHAVCDLVLRHAVESVPSRVASFAVPAGDGVLTIAATYGYPRVLVEHVKIPSGSGVIGTVYQNRSPMLVGDVAAIGRRERHRSRYNTRSFVSIPIVAGPEVLGVFSLTDRLDGERYSEADVDALLSLTAPAAIALSRERYSREAHAYAQAAIIDPVSGLFNRRYFQARLEEELHRASRQRTPVGLLMMDLDGFKGINDRFGHVAGDLVIRDVSDILRRSVRVFDVCTRFGGEEFAVMMPGGTQDSTLAIAERVRQRVEAHRRDEEELSTLHVTVSIGLAVSTPNSTARELVERADRALYHAKRSGKNRIVASSADGSIPSGH